MKFELPKENTNIIKVLGVGGGGSNAVNHMFRQGINGVDFLVCNTDQQALDISPVPMKVQLGATLTEGRGAGSIAEVGKNAAMETIDDIKDIISKNTKMVFITAGMGGGTGTGAAPVIAKTAREMGVLTVGIVTMPFFFEGKKRRLQAEQGIQDIRENVDTLLIINNEKLREMCGNLPIAQAFAMADNVLTTAARGIAEIITRTGYINVDFEDVRTVMSNSGVAIMGSATASGENRAIKAVEKALASPLLNDNDIKGARYVLLNITFGNSEVLMDEISEITDFIQYEAGASADVIWGYGNDDSLGDSLSVTLIATGFNQNPNTGENTERSRDKRRLDLVEETPASVAKTEETPTPHSAAEPFLKTQEEVAPMAEVRPASMEPQRTFEFEITKYNLEEPAPNPENSEVEALATETNDQPFLKSQEEETIAQAPAQPREREAMDAWHPYQKPAEPTPQERAGQPQLPVADDRPSREEQSKRAHDRLNSLRNFSAEIRRPDRLAHLENEPAFKRRQINLDDVPNSADSSASRLSLGEEENAEGEKRTKLRPNNPFLHDNVD